MGYAVLVIPLLPVSHAAHRSGDFSLFRLRFGGCCK